MIKKLFIVSGEASGDLHGSKVVKELLKIDDSLQINAWGGEKMKAEGANILKKYKELAFLGFWEVLKNITTIFSNFRLVKKQILESNAKTVILIDYPGFNLRLLPWLKKNNIQVIYYIAPQVWAWNQSRVHKMKKYIDKLIVILPFEQEFFSRFDFKVSYYGHPLMEYAQIFENNFEKTSIALLPGSRKQEIASNLPTMLELIKHYPNYKFVIAGLTIIGEEFYRKIIKGKPCEIVWDNTNEVYGKSKIAIVSSGTATLQTAISNIPQIVCYKSGKINYLIAKNLIKVKYISLVNLIMDRKVVKEMIQNAFNSKNLKKEIDRLLKRENYEKSLADYTILRKKLATTNSISEEVAKEIHALI